MNKDEFNSTFDSISKNLMLKINKDYIKQSLANDADENGNVSTDAVLGFVLTESIKYSNDLIREVLSTCLPFDD